MAAYATPEDMVNYYDVRTLGDLVADDGSTVPEAALPTNVKMLTVLSAATGRVDAAVLRGGRYTKEQLEALTGESEEYLINLTCAVAYCMLWKRRTWSDRYERTIGDACKEAEEHLAALRSGDEIFPNDTTIAAGLPDISAPSAVQLANNYQLVSDKARPRFYPVRRIPRL